MLTSGDYVYFRESVFQSGMKCQANDMRCETSIIGMNLVILYVIISVLYTELWTVKNFSEKN